MATIVLSAAGMALGGSIGGSVLGLSMATIGRAAGAAIGRQIDQKIMGAGSDPVETGRVDRLRLTGADEGADIQQIYGRMRVPGQVIWASEFKERSKTSGGGKGAPPTPEVTEFSYSVSLAIALCEGEIGRVGRIWADGTEVAQDDLNMRVYTGALDQQADPKIAAVEGIENTPAYRGTAYVVFEDMPLAQFGNRIPQLTFEVMRPGVDELGDTVTGVALIPGTGEYALATSQVYMSRNYGEEVAVNTNTPMGQSDFSASMDALQGEIPACQSVMLVVSWFGNDLRCGECDIIPKMEQDEADAQGMRWRVSGLTRSTAQISPELDGDPVYGGTPADAAVVEALQDMNARGLSAVFYPFILMEQLAGNSLPNPWTADVGQPVLPWRGRITTALAPNMDGTSDGTAAAVAEVAAFMGNAQASDFDVNGTRVSYTGPTDWGYRRFILHYAHLCAAAGGVSAFCIGSEMRALTQIRGVGNSFPAVEALIQLAADVRAILGPACKISYAADWSEYHGYQPTGTADKLFHLDRLWADANIDFIGVDNYMPLADWRDGEDHADIAAGAIYNLDYLRSNVAGGEGYDWYYPSPEAREAQLRTPITDGQGEPWLWRYKDFQGWWENAHHNRIDGVRDTTPTAWVPQSKPIWFTEFGCAALDKAANQPNKFIDPKSSESQLPYYSNGNRDDFMQMQYLRAIYGHFGDLANNPVSAVYGAPMVDIGRMHVWAWDARPYPFFPGNRILWSDGENYARGHWLNGRASNRALASVVAEICTRSGVTRFDVSKLYGVVRGYTVSDIGSGRAALQPLMVTYGFDAMERDGVLAFENRAGRADHLLMDSDLAIDLEKDQSIALTRSPAAETAARIQLVHLDNDADYGAIAAEAVHPDRQTYGVSKTEMPLALTRSEASNTVTRWLQEARIARDQASFALPPSLLSVGAGDVVELDIADHTGRYRVDRIEESGLRLIEATRIDAEIYRAASDDGDGPVLQPYVGPVPVAAVFMDLPLLTGDEQPTAPYIALGGRPWPGTIAVYGAPQDSDYTLQSLIESAAFIGTTQSALGAGPVGIWDRQTGLEVTLVNGELSSATTAALLSGANTIAIGDGTPDKWEILQFQTATPIGDRSYQLTGLLRGQAGSRGLMPDVWPDGSRVVVMDGAPTQIAIPSALRGLPRHFRYGPAKRPLTDASFRYAEHTFQGNGLRPYPVAYLRAQAGVSGTDLSWIRCSRIDGDIWADGEIPLGEDTESYQVRIMQDGITKRTETSATPAWSYPDATRISEVGALPYRIEVAQVSARFGAGPFVGVNLQV
ncbi:host specificity protein [Loktanella sp. D2R18]|uniref:baseplate multidomain protein megatron n=1 Tax=Rhodobacterales TaxID=204455 RepID=UPI000DEB1B19|nr:MULTISPECIES: glycoside hydrolase/phage tail family protein [Rhodobacterales]MDO6589712.1 glycoside hydrolase/phage tail family protein [Yoonia sp. 1_MG-2023]RBW44338.1 host specificity protein [Loktanella sp. D2R18]